MFINMLVKGMDTQSKEYDVIIGCYSESSFVGMIKGRMSYDSMIEYIDGAKWGGHALKVYLDEDILDQTIKFFGYNIFIY